jgi:hypothetical protein
MLVGSQRILGILNQLFSWKINELSPWTSVIIEKLTVAHLVRNTPPYMESECSFPCSQKSVTGPYPDPDEPNPHPSLRSVWIAIYAQVSQMASSLHDFLLKHWNYHCYCLCCMPCPSHPLRFSHRNNTWRVKIVKFPIMEFSSATCY